MAWGQFGFQQLDKLITNESDRIGSGASLRRQKSQEQVEQTRKEAAAGILGRVEGAKAAGIHPSVALGSNVSGAVLPVGNSFNSGGSYGLAESAMQQRELAMRREELEVNKAQEASRQSYEKQRLDADLEAAKLRNQLTQTQIDAQKKQMADSDRDFLAAQQQLARNQLTTSKPIMPAMKPQYIQVRDRFGKPVTIPNPDLYDLELPETVGAATLALPEFTNAPVSPWQRFLNGVSGWWEGIKAQERKRRAREGYNK